MAALKSKLGRANWKGVWGWALDADAPGQRLTVEIVIDDEVVGRVVADDPRPQLKILPPEQRDCGFQFLFPSGLSALSRHVIRARVAGLEAELEDSPMIVEPEPGLDPALEQTLGVALETAAATAHAQSDLDVPLTFVGEQIRRLMEARRTLPGGAEAPLPPALAGILERWEGFADAPSGIAAFPELPAAGTPARRMLVVGDEVRLLDDSARALAAQVASLVRLGATVDVVAGDPRADMAALAGAVEAAGATFLRPPLSTTVEEVLRRHRGLYETILIHRVTNYEKYAALARYYSPLARVVFSVDNLFFVRMLRRAALQNWAAGTEKGQALRLREMMAAWSAHAVLTHSAFEAGLLRQGVPQARVHVVRWPVVARVGRPAFAERAGLAFIGDFQQHADLDAAAWLLEVLMPAIWELDASLPCVIAGGNMPEALRTLQRERVEICEQKPDLPVDANPVLDRVRVIVAPYRASAGLPALVAASLAAGVPCVGSPAGMEALLLPELLRECVAPSLHDMAATAVRWHGDESQYARVAAAALAFVAESFSVAVVDGQMAAAVGSGEPSPAAAPAPAAELAAAG